MAYFQIDSHATQWRFIGRVNPLSIHCTMNDTTPVFLRRLGPESSCFKTSACPAVISMAGGDLALIGSDITAESTGRLPPKTAIGEGERIIRIPRKILLDALPDILRD